MGKLKIYARWVAFLPFAFLAAWLVRMFMEILQQHDPDGWWLHPMLERGAIVPRCHNLRGCYW
jgi:hypothetical protein